jgi:hypothetical protein
MEMASLFLFLVEARMRIWIAGNTPDRAREERELISLSDSVAINQLFLSFE